MCRGGRPTATTPSGWPSCCGTGGCGAATSRPAIRRARVEAARAAARTRTALRAQSSRLNQRRGSHRAAVAVAHAIIRISVVVLTRTATYGDLGPDGFERRHAADTEQPLVRKRERLGDTVTLEKGA